MILKSIEEIRKIRESALVVSKTLGMLATEIRPGITSLYLDNLAETFILDNFIIELYMGVRCHDSEREVPRLIKILSELKFSDEKLKIYLLKRDKTSDSGFEKGKNITNTPTIIFYKDSIEINRIVEFPIETLERDIYKIINDIEYRNEIGRAHV